MKTFAFIITLLVSSFAFAQEDKPIEVPKIAVKIPLGETVTIGGLQITFFEVVEDSRCPKNTTCVWEGKIAFKVKVNSTIKELTLQGANVPNLLDEDSKKITVIQVTPYPDAEIPPAERDAYCLLVIENK